MRRLLTVEPTKAMVQNEEWKDKGNTLMYTMMTLIKLCDKWHSYQVELQDMPRYLSANLILNFGGHVLKRPYIKHYTRALSHSHSMYITLYYVYGLHLYIYHSSSFPPQGKEKVVGERDTSVPISFWLFQFYHQFSLSTQFEEYSTIKYIVQTTVLYSTIPTHIIQHNTSY